jgi:hypothetical protein
MLSTCTLVYRNIVVEMRHHVILKQIMSALVAALFDSLRD